MTLQERLGIENQILIRDGFSQFQIYSTTDKTSYYLWGQHRSTKWNSYTIWSPIPAYYPDTRPPIYVYAPNPLPGYCGIKTINSYELSHHMHTLANGPNREVQICHWRDDRWHSGITLNKVMIKVLLSCL